MTKQLIRCTCGKRFPFNPDKYRYDKFIYCPFCQTPIRNPQKGWKLPKPSLGWIRKKLVERKAKREATKFLDRYFPKHPVTDERAFSLNAWMRGKRPALSGEQVKKALGYKPSEMEIEGELRWLESLGVRVR